MKILWDEPKRQSTLRERGIDFAHVTMDFIAQAEFRGTREGRSKVVGLLNGDIVTVIFKPLGSEAISIISMRRASRKERRPFQP